MKEINFIPKFLLGYKLGVLFTTLMNIFSVLLLIFSEERIPFLFISIILTALSLLNLKMYIKNIVFRNHEVEIEYYLFKNKTINYENIVDFGKTGIFTKNRKDGLVLTDYIINKDEFVQIINLLIDEGKINKSQIKNKLIKQEGYTKKAYSLAVYPTMILGLLSIIFFLDMIVF